MIVISHYELVRVNPRFLLVAREKPLDQSQWDNHYLPHLKHYSIGSNVILFGKVQWCSQKVGFK